MDRVLVLLQPQIQYCYGCTTDLLPAASKLHHPKLTDRISFNWNLELKHSAMTTLTAHGVQYRTPNISHIDKQTVYLYSGFRYWDDIISSINLCLCGM